MACERNALPACVRRLKGCSAVEAALVLVLFCSFRSLPVFDMHTAIPSQTINRAVSFFLFRGQQRFILFW